MWGKEGKACFCAPASLTHPPHDDEIRTVASVCLTRRLTGCILFPTDIKKALVPWTVSEDFTFQISSDGRKKKMG